MIVIKSL